ncbi:MAG: lipid-A-disaccharide synthase [Bacteroidales bacterium]|nr:lipid-A-disaccharide synthase [Bacteroidales bacterium]
MHYFIIAGEASGDLHASHLISALRRHDPAAIFTFLGGDLMAEASGEQPVIHYRDMAYMGFSEVLRNLGKISKNFSTARHALRMAAPDALILVDYPSFNLKMAAQASKAGVPVFYYISPKLWAWKKWRVADIRRHVARVMCILPFEPEFYRANAYDRAVYVGNPSVSEIDHDVTAARPRAEFLAEHRLRDRPLVALMPGSRRGEIKNNLPVMRAAVDRFPQYRGVIVGAPGIADELYARCGAGQLPVVRVAHAADLLVHCRAALVTSGTATLETALVGVPQVVTYRANGSKLSYDIMKRILSVDYVSLPNLITGSEIIPEMLLHECTSDLVAERLAPLLRDTPERAAQLDGYARMRTILGTSDAAETAAQMIMDYFAG